MNLPFRRAFLLLLALAATVCAEVQPATREEQIKVAQRVRDIFEAKCLDCHGPELPRPKGKFGYVLDLQRMADNPEYVVRGDPQSSELFKMVFNDEMPGEDAPVPALTTEEKEVVKRWVEIGAPGDLPTVSEADVAPASSVPQKVDPIWRRALRWVGKLHPVSTHFPVGLMMAAVLAEALAWWTRRDSWLQTVRFLVIIAALGGLGAAGLGWVNAYFSSYNKEVGALLWWHRWLGTGTAVWAGICAVLVIIDTCAEGTKSRQRFRGALLLGAALVGISGFLGSALIYGLDHYSF
jgi:uncharacterized membrane protein/mono/diheme cytochrome c family protein